MGPIVDICMFSYIIIYKKLRVFLSYYHEIAAGKVRVPLQQNTPFSLYVMRVTIYGVSNITVCMDWSILPPSWFLSLLSYL